MTIVANRRSVMLLYSDAISPLDHAVRLVLTEKDVNIEINYVLGDDYPEELNSMNPYSEILTLVDRDLVLYDAEIIMEYLDERFPHPPLMPVDPVSRAENRQLRFRTMVDLYTLVDELGSKNKTAVNKAKKEIRDNLTAIAPSFLHLPYFMSEEYSLVDCCLAPLLWRLPSYDIKLPSAAKPIQQYMDRIFDRPAFQQSLTEQELELRQ